MENIGFNRIKIQSLLDNLQMQIAANASADRVLTLARLLVAELQTYTGTETGRKNVSVVTPAGMIAAAVHKEEPVPLIDRFISLENEKPVAAEKETGAPPDAARVSQHFNAWDDPSVSGEAPTISLQNVPVIPDKDINEIYTGSYDDVVQSLQNIPVRDLTTDIGINDRYLFINELFRGDETMYERTVITLNKFHNYEEASNWAERELRLQFGWDAENATAKQFEQLIKRRFC